MQLKLEEEQLDPAFPPCEESVLGPSNQHCLPVGDTSWASPAVHGGASPFYPCGMAAELALQVVMNLGC